MESIDDVPMKFFDGSNTKPVISALCPHNVFKHSPLLLSQIFDVLSNDPVNTKLLEKLIKYTFHINHCVLNIWEIELILFLFSYNILLQITNTKLILDREFVQKLKTM